MDDHQKRVVFSENAKGSASDCWATPRELIKQIEDDHWARFTLDAAATERSRICFNYLGPDHPSAARRNALTVNWADFNPDFGDVWLNPPYAKGGINDWFEKVREEIRSGAHRAIYVLIPARTDTKWWHKYVMEDPHCHEVYLIRGRLKFLDDDPEGLTERDAAPFPSAVLVYESELRHKMHPLFDVLWQNWRT